MIEYKSIQRAMARLDPVRREEENEQRHTRRGEPARREEEQSTNTSQLATARLEQVTSLGQRMDVYQVHFLLPVHLDKETTLI